ncbi:MAG: hypothetical protein ACLQVD_04840 [Capsulimonadaceae bacterium]
MDVLINDLSVAGQFADISEFRDATRRVMQMRIVARRFGYDLRCHRNLVNAQVTRDLLLKQAIQTFPVDERRNFMQWVTQIGPFWEDDRSHTSDDYMEYNSGAVVTDRAIGEAAYACFHGVESAVVSFTPSDWEFSPVPVRWFRDSDIVHEIDVANFWSTSCLEETLSASPQQLASWDETGKVCRARFPNLTFAGDAFDPLQGHPFVRGAADGIVSRLNVLNKLCSCFDDEGQMTATGHQIVEQYFSGAKAWFSPSSDSEIRDFANELSFRHPTIAGEYLICHWHGKVKTPQLRIHFSWPVRSNSQTYVVYVGPKITKR